MDYGYHQPASALASVGVMAAGTGATSSKYVARRETPLYIPENCTQCMECITACPDTALPNTAQDVEHRSQDSNYQLCLRSPRLVRGVECSHVPAIEEAAACQKMIESHRGQRKNCHSRRSSKRTDRQPSTAPLPTKAKAQLDAILDVVPDCLQQGPRHLPQSLRKKNPGGGGAYSQFLSPTSARDVVNVLKQCGDHGALVMVPDTEELNQTLTGAQIFSAACLPDTPQKYLGLYKDDAPEDSRPAALRNHLMVRRNYEALVSGDGACAGCGEKVHSACCRFRSPRPICARYTTARPTVSTGRPGQLKLEENRILDHPAKDEGRRRGGQYLLLQARIRPCRYRTRRAKT